MLYNPMAMRIMLWEIRNKLNVSLRKLESLTGIDKDTLNNIENEKTSPTMKQMERMAKALNVKISQLYESEYK
jgi:Helix-turn-helix.